MDLHIHTVLSSCAELSMGPKDIVHKAVSEGLDMIAITDHNAADNVAAVIGAARNWPLTVIAGMEVSTKEEAHVLCLFEDVDRVMRFQEFIQAGLPEGVNDESFFGSQIICDENEHVLGKCEKLLAFSTRHPFDSVAAKARELGGIVIPAHIDRKSCSLLKAFGFVPQNAAIDALEIQEVKNLETLQMEHIKNSGYPIVTDSDAHDVDRIGSRYTYIYAAEASFVELKAALKGDGGRRILVREPAQEVLEATLYERNDE